MLFNSLPFLFFYLIVTTLFFLIKDTRRWILLLIASCYFYITFVPAYLLIIAFTIVVDYYVALALEKTLDKKKRKRLLIFSLVANIGVLAIFKYYNFFASNVNQLFNGHGALLYLKILLPIGLSFHTFQAMSYTIEVYRGNQQAEKHFGIYALYVMFYPQLVAGPIERPQNIIHQFYEKHPFNYDNLKAGLMQMATGFFKKVIIADRLAILVDGAYLHPRTQSGITLLIATLFYSFQIYCDFSGYSDIAIGAARTMGFTLMDNFRAPYFSRSVNEFWTRWHISLSTWFRDYLYIPLGGNRVRVSRWYFNLMIVFIISGFWHGANWTFIVWGALHGTFLIVHIACNKLLQRWGYQFKPNPLKTLLQVIFTFLLVSVAWIFFRATYVSDAIYIVKSIFHINFNDHVQFSLNNNEIWFSVFLIVLLCLKERFYLIIPTKKNLSFIILFSIIVFSCYFFGVFNNKQFIYFQF
ncbi:MAG: alginate O-acetyltransferase [Mucilaginibacter sp.]|uniref:MBOAT family O-acyltransferase n=1 Tax=Mucilaginibacter sp. TaxID=1882438 RepID=UPI00263A2A12|nr:MBOAT family O-acyltransferase [Mucilaginibacter sp.]MDB5003964.1 alginate O-acetyltransferase [Mucilaginibacter sp.]